MLSIEADGLYFGKVRIGDVYQEVDGYYVYVAPLDSRGAFTSYDLKIIAEFLDELNEPWDKEVREYFENNPD